MLLPFIEPFSKLPWNGQQKFVGRKLRLNPSSVYRERNDIIGGPRQSYLRYLTDIRLKLRYLLKIT